MNKAHKMDLLVALYIFLLCAAELMGGKTFPIISSGAIKLNASVAIFLSPSFSQLMMLLLKCMGQSVREM